MKKIQSAIDLEENNFMVQSVVDSYKLFKALMSKDIIELDTEKKKLLINKKVSDIELVHFSELGTELAYIRSTKNKIF